MRTELSEHMIVFIYNNNFYYHNLYNTYFGLKEKHLTDMIIFMCD